MNIAFEKDNSSKGCPCEQNPDQEDFIYLCRKCGSGYIFKSGVWTKEIHFSEEALREIFLLLNS